MEKVDLKKELKALYGARKGVFEIVEVPHLAYFAIDGKGDPNTALAYREAIEALYAVSYTLKFMSKKELERDYVVPPLEGLWWADDMTAFRSREKDKWSWTMMIMIPGFIPTAMAKRAIAAAGAKKELPALSKLDIKRLKEGKAVQILHVGSYDDESPTLVTLHDAFLPANGLVEAGHHHEIYLSDPRKVASTKLRTILRQPVKAKT
jgi:hypothetical protein